MKVLDWIKKIIGIIFPQLFKKREIKENNESLIKMVEINSSGDVSVPSKYVYDNKEKSTKELSMLQESFTKYIKESNKSPELETQ